MRSSEVAPGRNAPPWREVIEHLPYGVVVGGSDRGVLSLNRAAVELVGDIPVDGTSTCCDLFGCNAAGGPLASACISELALKSVGQPLPEIRIDLQSRSAAWLTANAQSKRWIVFHLRPGDHGDRRKRTHPHWLAGPKLAVSAFGKLGLESGEGAIGGQWLEQRPGQLFKYLVSNRQRVVPSDELAEAFWPSTPTQSLNNVRHFVHVLRERLEPGRERRTESAFVVARAGGYMLDRNRVQIDADEFERLTRAGLGAIKGGDSDGAERCLEAAMDLYTGPFIADEPYAEWTLFERDRLHELASSNLRSLANLRLSMGNFEGAANALRHLADLNPYDSAAERELITLTLRQGRRSEAVRRYSALRVRLLRQFGEAPDFDLAELITKERMGSEQEAPPTLGLA